MMLAFVDLEERVPASHPLRVIKQFADRALAELSPVFDTMYAAGGRPSIPPERLLKASLLIALYSVRSERAFCEELDFHLLHRWFLDMSLMEPSFDPTVFTKNRQRLLKHDVARQFFDEVVCQANRLGLLSDEHFTVDGTLIEAAASLKSFRPKDEPHGRGWGAAFETRIGWSPHGATGTIESKLARAGYRRVAKSERFVVAGAYGPLRDGELEQARQWGAALAHAFAAKQA
jgi:transposase